MKEVTSKVDNSCGVVSVVLGIIGILFSSLGGVILGVVGLVFGIKQKKYTPQNKWAIAGIILNIISIVLGILLFILALYLASYLFSSLTNLESLAKG
jgi:hypothetical protein